MTGRFWYCKPNNPDRQIIRFPFYWHNYKLYVNQFDNIINTSAHVWIYLVLEYQLASTIFLISISEHQLCYIMLTQSKNMSNYLIGKISVQNVIYRYFIFR